ncbi:uncharacterized protein RSE6_02773 [Rhynchosporium secalis]|uniref:Uncharacterized protein n=1 Tax=Rhynchosporium secalis TaxID=38038 RepID=A0A1E1M128_RHYSE|nr:uncharacterized protein RSE6_02773 [Rhynchosporium secalis]
MNRIPRRLGTSSTAFFLRRLCHVHAFQRRVAFRCIHSRASVETRGSRSKDKNKNSALENSPEIDGSHGGAPLAVKGKQSQGGTKGEIWRYTKAKSRHRPHVLNPGRKPALKRHRKFNDPYALTSSEPPRQKPRTILGERRPRQISMETPPQISCTIVYDVPEQATKENFLGYLRDSSKMNYTTQWRTWPRNNRNQALVILFTPGLAAFVGNDPSFVPDVLKAMTRTSTVFYEHALEVDVVCGCVDGLAPIPSVLSKSRAERSREGFSILHGSRDSTLPLIWTNTEAPPSRSPSMQATITLRKGDHGPPDLTLPLANTLFKNGRLSTLLVSNWHWRPSAKESWVLKKGPSERSNVNINIFGDATKRQPSLVLPAVRLTPARPIVSGLGNIVRTIDFGAEDGIGPASRELEPTVTKYLETMGHGNTTINVWALVVPPESVPMAAKSGTPMDPNTKGRYWLTDTSDTLQKNWLSSYNDDATTSRYIAALINTKNAKLCRVLSGGGGWGAKQGLLSLDPQITYDEIPEARFDFSGGSLEDQQTSALGNIAQAGAFVQFFVARREHLTRPVEPGGVYLNALRKSAVFGAVPSTVDDVLVPSSETSRDSTGSKRAWKSDDTIHTHRGHFGFVSERGMFLRHGRNYNPERPNEPCNFTKIDLPHSYFYMDYRSLGEGKPGTPVGARSVNTEGKAVQNVENTDHQSEENTPAGSSSSRKVTGLRFRRFKSRLSTQEKQLLYHERTYRKWVTVKERKLAEHETIRGIEHFNIKRQAKKEEPSGKWKDVYVSLPSEDV